MESKSINIPILVFTLITSLTNMPSTLNFRPTKPTTSAAVVAIWLAFCADVGAGFLGPSAFTSNLKLHRQLLGGPIFSSPAMTIPRMPYNSTSAEELPQGIITATPFPDSDFDQDTDLLELNFENDIKQHIDIERPYCEY